MSLATTSYDFLQEPVRDHYPFIAHVSTKKVRFVVKKLLGGDLVVKKYGTKETVFIVKFRFTKLHFQLLVHDAKENRLFMLQRKTGTLHARWNGFCDSALNTPSFKKQVFTMSKCKVIQDHTEIYVSLTEDKDMSLKKYGPLVYNLSPETEAFLDWKDQIPLFNNLLDKEESLLKEGTSPELEMQVASIKASLEKFTSLKVLEKGKRKEMEMEKGEFDFMIRGSCSRKELTIFKRDLKTVIAKVSPHADKNKKNRFNIDIESKVDCIFVISLIAAVDSMKITGKLQFAGKALSGAFNVFGVVGPVINAGVGMPGMITS